MKKIFSCLAVFFWISLTDCFAQKEEKIHQDPEGLTDRCVCHTRSPGDPKIVKASEAQKCYFCHGAEEKRKKAKEKKFIKPKVSLLDIESEFTKLSIHPVEKTEKEKSKYNPWRGITDPNPPRISKCTNCHNAHISSKKVKTEKGSKKPGTYRGAKEKFDYEYQLCYKCHSYSVNLPPGSTNKAIEFQPTNPSYHPVEAEGKGVDVPSILPPYKVKNSFLNCTDCHNNDNPKGPDGPHGSIYAPILIKNYTTKDGEPESEFTYALCYECHSRTSILRNESFTYHSQHIVEKKISCYSCHNSHGSVKYTSLIEFRPDRTQPDSFGRFEYVQGRCYLKCHEYEHK